MRMTEGRARVASLRFAFRSFDRLRGDEAGATAVEFAAVVVPFLTLVFGFVGVSFYFFIMNSVEKGMDQTSRLVRTGQAQAQGMTVKEFKQSICDKAGDWIKCDDLQIFPATATNWNLVAPKPCVVNNVVQTTSVNENDKIGQHVGCASKIVTLTACYKWNFTQNIPFVDFGNMGDGSYMLQAATAFRSEPYDDKPCP